jgi:zinc finger SWIM domain-containing protein 3
MKKICSSIRFGPVLPQTALLGSGDLEKFLEPMHVQGRGAPKKRLQAKIKTQRSNGKCGYCGTEGHNRRTCKKLIEVVNLSKFHCCMCISH